MLCRYQYWLEITLPISTSTSHDHISCTADHTNLVPIATNEQCCLSSVFQWDKHNPLAFLNDHLYEIYGFSADGIVYRLLDTHIKNLTLCLAYAQKICIQYEPAQEFPPLYTLQGISLKTRFALLFLFHHNSVILLLWNFVYAKSAPLPL